MDDTRNFAPPAGQSGAPGSQRLELGPSKVGHLAGNCPSKFANLLRLPPSSLEPARFASPVHMSAAPFQVFLQHDLPLQ